MYKICKYCATKNSSDGNFCENCGAVLEEEIRTENNVNNNTQTIQNNTINNMNNNDMNSTTKTNPTAIGGFVCSLVGLLVFGVIMGILAICLGATAKKQIKVFNQKGGGLATAAIVIGIIDIVLPIIYGIMTVAFLI